MLQISPPAKNALLTPQLKHHNCVASDRGMAFHHLVGQIVENIGYWNKLEGPARIAALKKFVLLHTGQHVRRFVSGHGHFKGRYGERKRRVRASWLAHALDDLLIRIDDWGLTDIRVEKQLPIFMLEERLIDVGAPDLNGLLPNRRERICIELKTGECPNHPGIRKVNNYTLGAVLEYKASEMTQPLAKVVWLSYSIRAHRHEVVAKYTRVPHVECTEAEVDMHELSLWTKYHYGRTLAYLIRNYQAWLKTPRHLRRYPKGRG